MTNNYLSGILGGIGGLGASTQITDPNNPYQAAQGYGQAYSNAYNPQYHNVELDYYRNKEAEERELEAKHPGLAELRNQYEMMKVLCKGQDKPE